MSNDINPVNMNWKDMQISDLQEAYPTASKEALKLFLRDIQRDIEHHTYNKSQFGVDMKYPQGLLEDKSFSAIASLKEYYNDGFGQGQQQGMIDDWKDDLSTLDPNYDQDYFLSLKNSIFDAEKDLETMEQLPALYDEAVKDYIDTFKNLNPAFKDVNIPYFHPPMPDYFDVNRNGKPIQAERIEDKAVQATQFCLMKDETDKKSPYFVMAYRVDKIDDIADYKLQNLSTKNLAEAKSMFADVVAGRPPKGLSIKEKMEAAIAKSAAQHAQNPDISKALNNQTKSFDVNSVTR